MGDEELIARLARLVEELEAVQRASRETGRKVHESKETARQIANDARLLDTSEKLTRRHRRKKR
jgi:hypothetical protein